MMEMLHTLYCDQFNKSYRNSTVMNWWLGSGSVRMTVQPQMWGKYRYLCARDRYLCLRHFRIIIFYKIVWNSNLGYRRINWNLERDLIFKQFCKVHTLDTMRDSGAKYFWSVNDWLKLEHRIYIYIYIHNVKDQNKLC